MIRPRQYVPLLAFTLLPHGLEIVNWALITAAFLVSWALLSDFRPRLAPRRWVLAGLTLLAPLLVFWQFGTLLGPEAATTLLLLMVCLKLFEVYTYRDSIIILLLTVLIGMYHLVFRQDLLATVYIFIVLIWVFVFLFRQHQPSTTLTRSSLQLRSLLGPETLISIPLALMLFFFFPRFTSPFGRFVESPDAQTGFSDELRPGDMSRLANSDEVAFRVEFKSESSPAPSDLYFFGQSLSETDGINWSKPKGMSPQGVRPWLVDETGFSYRLTIEPRFGRQAFYLRGTSSVEIRGISSPFNFMSNDSLLLRDSATKTYQVTGQSALKPLPALPTRIDYTYLPPDFLENQPRVKQVVSDLIQSPSGRTKKVQDLLSFFRNQGLTYSMNTPSYTNIEQLLFETKVGFCEHFASAFALMARSAGIPSRVIVGFHGGEFNEYGNYLIVRDRQAHAWVEVLMEDNTWHLADPTSAVNIMRISLGDNPDRALSNPSRESLLAAAIQSTLFYIDSMNNRFTLFLLNFDGSGQIEFLEDWGLHNLNRKKLWMILGGAVFIFSLLAYLYFRLQTGSQTKQEALRRLLNQKLHGSNIGFSDHLGPIETLDLLKRSEVDNKDLLIRAVSEYTQMYYGAPTDSAVPNRRLKKLKSDLEKL